MKLLIKNADIVTGIKGAMFLKNHSIGIDDSKIIFLDQDNKVKEGFKPDKIIDAKNKIVMPGLVNAHTHSSMTLLRNAADDVALHKWLFEKIFPLEAKLSEEDIYWGTMLAIAEMLKSGTTAFADMYLHMDRVAQAVCESGIRATLSRSLLDFQKGDGVKPINAADKCRTYHKNWHGKGDGRLKVYIEVHSTYLFDVDSLKEAACLAKELGSGINIHVQETQKELEDSLSKYGKTPTELLVETGILDVPVIAAHCVHVRDNDISILKEKNASVAHNPTSNLKLGSGIAPIPEFIRRGINIALGTDGAASNNNLNMFEEMHLAALIHKGAGMNAELLDAEQTILMATANGAVALGFGNETGCIRVGMNADIILINTDVPHIQPVNNPISAVVYSVQASDVDTVLVDGKVLMENKQLTTIDEERIKHEARRVAARII